MFDFAGIKASGSVPVHYAMVDILKDVMLSMLHDSQRTTKTSGRGTKDSPNCSPPHRGRIPFFGDYCKTEESVGLIFHPAGNHNGDSKIREVNPLGSGSERCYQQRTDPNQPSYRGGRDG